MKALCDTVGYSVTHRLGLVPRGIAIPHPRLVIPVGHAAIFARVAARAAAALHPLSVLAKVPARLKPASVLLAAAAVRLGHPFLQGFVPVVARVVLLPCRPVLGHLALAASLLIPLAADPLLVHTGELGVQLAPLRRQLPGGLAGGQVAPVDGAGAVIVAGGGKVGRWGEKGGFECGRRWWWWWWWWW